MNKRRIGKTDLITSTIAIGGNVFGWTLNEHESFRILDEWIDNQCNFIDTADVYSIWNTGHCGGESETIIGKWMNARKNRSKVIITTKVGANLGQIESGLSKDHITKSINNSLKRLKTDYVDLYLSHYDDKDTPIEETLRTYQNLINEGKIRYIGASNFSPDRLLTSLETSINENLPMYQNLQPEYNLFTREPYESQYKSIGESYHLGITPYFSLASGFLTGKYRNENDILTSSRHRWTKKYLNDRGFNILEAMDTISKDRNEELATIAIAWLISKPFISAAITSATSTPQINSIIQGANLELTQNEIFLLDKASSYSD